MAVIASGCGSAAPKAVTHPVAKPKPTAGWHVVSTRTFTGRKVAVIGGTVSHPAALKVTVSSRPNVISQINYSIDCEKSGTHPVAGTMALRRTPLTVSIPVTPRAASCFVDVTASKSASADLTIRLVLDTA